MLTVDYQKKERKALKKACERCKKKKKTKSKNMVWNNIKVFLKKNKPKKLLV